MEKGVVCKRTGISTFEDVCFEDTLTDLIMENSLVVIAEYFAEHAHVLVTLRLGVVSAYG